eukprot:CAMPEP_0115320444 /NCGR_PEP_ID=MMETSP0270-20121206/80319_1 /TAXON_ID=71861 /ORGANISM="Scrippsiella trochoidea, Strain CCMP3099" /LENGTH=63 /DNA_ID=CAMNT_0002740237 /DNA_START=305 /DNA_END=493 /DNA_ORIENTATION=-
MVANGIKGAEDLCADDELQAIRHHLPRHGELLQQLADRGAPIHLQHGLLTAQASQLNAHDVHC